MDKDNLPMLLESLLAEAFTSIEKAKPVTPRALSFPEAENMIKVAIGMRRSGKTYFLYQTIHQLLTQGVPQTQILFVNFEDERLLPMSAQEMGQLLDSFYRLYPENHQRRCYFFLDEVQNVVDWHLVIRRFFDSKNVQIYLTGSSAKLLSKEINTRLRGRSLAIEVLPYNFCEFLSARHIELPKLPFGQAAFDHLYQALMLYFSQGGFPGVQTMEISIWRETLQNYVDTVIFRDIIERYGITNIAVLKYLITTLLKNSGAPFSVNKFFNDIKSQGFKISKDTLHTYIKYIEDAFLIFTVPIYSESLRAKQTNSKKIYAIDTGLINALSTGTNDQYGKLFENLIYLDLRRQKKSVYFYTTHKGYEVDFVTIDLAGNKELIQAVWDTQDEKTLQREQRALKIAEEELGIKGQIITAWDYLKNLAPPQSISSV